MKKWLLAALILLLLVIAAVYIFIPSSVKVADYTIIKATKGATYRYISDEDYWQKWWPKQARQADSSFTYNGYHYNINNKFYNSIDLSISKAHFKINSSLEVIPLTKDSIAVQWQYAFPATYNPLLRIKYYTQARQLKQNSDTLLNHLQHYMRSKRNIYDFTIVKDKVRDSFLVTTVKVFPAYPSTKAVYQLFDYLKAYAAKKDAHQTSYPMLNITQIDSDHYKTTVGIPVNKELSSTGNITFKWFIAGGPIMCTTVKGGPSQIQNALDQLHYYLVDHEEVILAIPYESLINNRLETDSSKWMTRVCYPTFQ